MKYMPSVYKYFHKYWNTRQSYFEKKKKKNLTMGIQVTSGTEKKNSISFKYGLNVCVSLNDRVKNNVSFNRQMKEQ